MIGAHRHHPVTSQRPPVPGTLWAKRPKAATLRRILNDGPTVVSLANTSVRIIRSTNLPLGLNMSGMPDLAASRMKEMRPKCISEVEGQEATR